VFALPFGCPEVVVNLVEINSFEVATPFRQRTGVEGLERLEAIFEHPGRLVLDLRDLFDDLSAQTFLRLEDELLRVVESKLVLASFDVDDLRCVGHDFTPCALSTSWI